MKKTYNINVAGYPFIIDEDAYVLLNEYIEAIEHAFNKNDDYKELITDIESRVAELLLEYTSAGGQIITVNEVEEVIRRIGKPEEMVEDEESISIKYDNGNNTVDEEIKETEAKTITPPPYNGPSDKPNKKLYRDSQNSMIGGVCSGLAWYFGWDPTWVRVILLAVILLCPFTFFKISTIAAILILAYIVLWICLPEAITPIQRMEMMGENPTIENIGKTVTDNFREDQGMTPPSQRQQTRSTIGTIFSILVKCIAGFFIISGIGLLVLLSIGLLGCIFSLIMIFTTGLSFLPFEIAANTDLVCWSIACGFGGILFIGIPLFLVVRMALYKNKSPLSSTTKWVLVTICVLGFLLSAVSAGMIIKENNGFVCNSNWIESRHNYIFESDDDSSEELSWEEKVAREEAAIAAEEAAAAASEIKQEVTKAVKDTVKAAKITNKAIDEANKSASSAIKEAQSALESVSNIQNTDSTSNK